jgi:hypothetical protein
MNTVQTYCFRLTAVDLWHRRSCFKGGQVCLGLSMSFFVLLSLSARSSRSSREHGRGSCKMPIVIGDKRQPRDLKKLMSLVQISGEMLLL